MVQLTVIKRDGEAAQVAADKDRTVMDAIRDYGIGELAALCGGCCSCATCHIYVDAGNADVLPPISEDEDSLLSASDYRLPTSRLSCQLRVSDSLDGLRIVIAPEG